MADKLKLGSEVRELKIGSSFTNPKNAGFHTLRYDFKPASVDSNQMAKVDVGQNSQVTVTIPPNTVFKGSAKPYQKQCVIIINRETNEITLEKLSCNLQVKQTRSENRKAPASAPSIPTIDQFTSKKKTAQKHSSNTKSSNKTEKTKSKPQLLAATLGNMVPKHSPLHASPNRKSPNPVVGLSPNRQHTASNASLPSLGFGFDDAFGEEKPKPPPPVKEKPPMFKQKNNIVKKDFKNQTPKPDSDISRLKPIKEDVKLSDSSSSSSSSSSSDSSSDSDSDSPESVPVPLPMPMKKVTKKRSPPPAAKSSLPSMPEHLLTEDLQLSSESGSEY